MFPLSLPPLLSYPLSGLEFPWGPKPFAEVVAGPLLRNNRQTTDSSSLEGHYVGVYFSAHWVSGEKTKRTPSFFLFFFFPIQGSWLCENIETSEKKERRQHSRKRQEQIRERSETPLCLTVYITAVDDLHQSFHHQLWISHHTPKTSHRCFFSLLPLPIASEGHDSRCMEGVKSSLCCSWWDAARAAEASRRSSCQSRSLRYRLLRMVTPECWRKPQSHIKLKGQVTKSNYRSLFAVFYTRVPRLLV